MPPSDITVRLRMLGAKRFEAEATQSGRSLDTIGRSAKRGQSSMGRFNKETDRSHKHLRLLGRGAAYALGAGGFGGGLYALFDVTKKSIGQFQESQRVTRQTAAAIRSTGGAAGVTAKGVAELSNAIALKTGIDDEAIQTSSNLLLTFTKIRNEAGRGNDVFNQSTRAITDMATAMNHGATPSTADLHAASLQLGKALNDPVKGAGALRRVGVQLDDQQQSSIKTLVKQGKTMEAQKIILAELNKEFGGSAVKQATPMKRLQVSLGNLAETIGGALNPFVQKAAVGLNKFVVQMQSGKGAGGAFVHTLKQVWSATFPVISVFFRAGVAVAKFAGKHPTLTKLALAITGVGLAINAVRTSKAVAGIGTLIGSLKRLGKTKAGEAVVENITGASGLGGLTRKSSGPLGTFRGNLKSKMGSIGRAGGIAFGVGFAAWASKRIDDWVNRHLGKNTRGQHKSMDKSLGGGTAPRFGGPTTTDFLGISRDDIPNPLDLFRQHGGPIRAGMTGIVGEHQPELVTNRGGSVMVSPLPFKRPALAPVAAGAGGGSEETVTRIPVYLDGRVLTEVVEKRTRQKRARG